MTARFDSVLIVGFGGPTRAEEIRPFLQNVTRGRNIPSKRIDDVAHHYELMGGKSPYNELTMRQVKALQELLRKQGPDLPVYVGMRNWHPYLKETLLQMADAGHRKAIGFILAPHQSEASWDRYQQNVREAQSDVGERAPSVEYLDPWFAHPLFIEAAADRVRSAIGQLPERKRAEIHLIFTAHSIPVAMASPSPYVEQLTDSSRAVAAALGIDSWSIAFQSRSGSPREPWLEPDVNDSIRRVRDKAVVIVPIGFICDHVEVLYDLDVEVAAVAREAGVTMVRVQTVNDHPKFIGMIAELIGARARRGE